ncbi:PAS domain S-box protein [Chitinimonas sp. BJYL2]|uniref:PAS domain S-box protein n=1 Tax=Chitinimonas sp. BJYL2 TaxID=2976696 RepID=UPI0022B3A3D8|nr:PAS domain S-box protein [Chitinimonas sp. BJYL2]
MQADLYLSQRRHWLRSLVSTLLPLLVLALGASWWWWHHQQQVMHEELQARNERILLRVHQELSSTLLDGGADLMMLANDPTLAVTLGEPAERWAEHADHFLSLMRFKPVYDQIRLLDLQGKERLRVNLNRGDPYPVPAISLQDKRGHDYFRDAVNLSRGRIFLSSLDLNVERGRLERPLKPVIRFSTPVYDAAGVKRAVLVVNLLVTPALTRLEHSTRERGQLMLFDARGQWLLGGRIEDNFGIQAGTGRTLSERDPALWKLLQSSGAAGNLVLDQATWSYRQMAPRAPLTQGDKVLLRLPFVTPARQGDWYLVMHQDAEAMSKLKAPLVRTQIIVTAGAVMLACLAAMVIANMSVRRQGRRHRQAAFQALLAQAPVAVIMLDGQFDAQYSNDAWTELTGLSLELSQGVGWWSVLDHADRERLQASLHRFVQQAQAEPLDLQLRLPDGRRRWVSCLFSGVPDSGSAETGVVLSLADIQASKEHESRLAGALQLVNGVVTGSGDAILAVDNDWQVLLSNPALGQAFGMVFNDVPEVGESFLEWLAGHPADRNALQSSFGLALQGKPKQLRILLGAMRRVFDCSFAPLLDEAGRRTGAILFARDVTEMARIQTRVARSEELFRSVFAGSLDAVFVMEAVKDPADKIVDFLYIEANPEALSAVGRSREQFIGKLQSELFPTRRAEYFDRYIRAIETGMPFAEEVRHDHEGLAPGWYENRVVPMGWGVTLTSRNITSRKQSELALAASEALQRNIFDSSPYAIIAADADGLITLFNKAAERMLGYRAADVIGLHTPLLFHDNTELARYAMEVGEQLGMHVEPNAQVFALGLQGRQVEREWTYIRQDGSAFPVSLTMSPRLDAEGRVIGSMGIAYDISEQKQLEIERDRLEAVIENLPDIVRMTSLDGDVIYLNAAGRRLFQLAPDASLKGFTKRDGYTEWSYQLISNVGIPKALAEGSWQGETQWVSPDGRIIDMRQLIVAPRMQGKPPTFTAAVLHDLSEVRAMEAKMVEEDALLNSILESVQDAIVVINEAGKVELLNPAVADVFGYGLHKVMSQPASMLLPPPLAAQQRAAFERYIETGEQTGRVLGQRIEVLGQRRDGTSFPMELTVSEIHFGGKRVFTWVMRDISERKAFEEKLLQNIDELEAAQQALNAANEQLLDANVELGRMAQQDGLTGVANRRAFDTRLAAEWGREARSGEHLSLIMIDVDHFKKYNDGYGHQMGDECLRQVAAVLRESLSRPADFVARYGGEEFAIILPDTEGAGALEVAEHVRQRLAEAAIPHAHSTTAPHVTLSMGVATMRPLKGVKPETLIASADAALYRAKKEGRNRAVLAGEGPT